MGLAPACGGSPGGLHAELRLRLLQLCHAGAVGVAGGPAHALRQLVPQLPLHALGLQVQLGQLRDGRTDGRTDGQGTGGGSRSQSKTRLS